MSDATPTGRRAQAVKLPDPAARFEGWHFSIERHHWEVLGLRHSQFFKDRKPYLSWAVDVPPRLDFLEGTVFYAGDQFLQVAWVGGDGFVEVHTGTRGADTTPLRIDEDGRVDLSTGFCVPRTGYLVREADLVTWLQKGTPPAGCTPLTRAQSSCTGLARMALPPDDEGGPGA